MQRVALRDPLQQPALRRQRHNREGLDRNVLGLDVTSSEKKARSLIKSDSPNVVFSDASGQNLKIEDRIQIDTH